MPGKVKYLNGLDVVVGDRILVAGRAGQAFTAIVTAIDDRSVTPNIQIIPLPEPNLRWTRSEICLRIDDALTPANREQLHV
jgi:hypothetical protein